MSGLISKMGPDYRPPEGEKSLARILVWAAAVAMAEGTLTPSDAAAGIPLTSRDDLDDLEEIAAALNAGFTAPHTLLSDLMLLERSMRTVEEITDRHVPSR
jgi:hypothetical protein